MTNKEATKTIYWLIDWLVENDARKEVIDVLKVALEALEKTRWIPCSERMPEDGQYVLASTTDFGALAMIYTEPYCWNEVSGEEDYYGYGCSSEFVKAWMPLPEPYKECEDE